MKCTLMLTLATTGILVLCSGCVNSLGSINGYGFAPPALVYSGQTFGSHSEPNLEILKRPYEIIGPVTGEATTANVMLVCAFGDSSIKAAERDALNKVKNADAIINRTFYTKHSSILCLFTQVTNCVSGDAIRYLDDGKHVK